MHLLARLPSRVLTVRGWGLVSAGVLALLTAQILGRRDLLYVGVLLVCLPLLSVLMLRLIKPRFTVERTFAPQTIETGFASTVTLSVRSSGPLSGTVLMQERIPARFGDSPEFHFPSRHPSRQGASSYEYRLRSSARGVYDVGPVTAAFTDPFGLGTSRHTLGGTDRLVVTPAPLELPYSPLTGARGADGFAATRRNANPSDDDVMTREYRAGDPMRRVHWAATARHSELMVRQEESVTTPEATLILDQRQARYSSGFPTAFGLGNDDGTSLLSSPGFEWAVVAAMSITAHLLERNYALRFVDEAGAPAMRSSVSAPWPDDEEHQGQTGIHNIAEGLAALELSPDPTKRATTRHPSQRATSPSRASQAGPNRVAPFGDPMMDKLATYKHRGPLLALLGTITAAEARDLAAAAEFGSTSFAILVADRPQDLQPVMEILRAAGWHAVAVSPSADLAAAWTYFDSPGAASASTAKTSVPSGGGWTGGRA